MEQEDHKKAYEQPKDHIFHSGTHYTNLLNLIIEFRAIVPAAILETMRIILTQLDYSCQ